MDAGFAVAGKDYGLTVRAEMVLKDVTAAV
jgi:hypothetical protein